MSHFRWIVLMLVGLGLSYPSFAERCTVEDSNIWTLTVQLRKPHRRHFVGMQKQFLSRVSHPEPVCLRDGTVAVQLTTKEIREQFGSSVKLTCVAGAGGSSDTSAYFAEFTLAGRESPSLKLFSSRNRFENDPMWNESLSDRQIVKDCQF